MGAVDGTSAYEHSVVRPPHGPYYISAGGMGNVSTVSVTAAGVHAEDGTAPVAALVDAPRPSSEEGKEAVVSPVEGSLSPNSRQKLVLGDDGTGP